MPAPAAVTLKVVLVAPHTTDGTGWAEIEGAAFTVSVAVPDVEEPQSTEAIQRY